MISFQYDGTFLGLLSVVYYSLKEKVEPTAIVTNREKDADLFSSLNIIPTDEEKATQLIDYIEEKMSKWSLRHIYRTFLSEAEKRELLIFNYVRFGLKVGKEVDRFLTDDRVQMVHRLSQRVGMETQRMKGFVRFAQLKDEIYYAKIKTDYFILPLIAPHFKARISDQKWVIHDVKREQAAFYDQKKIIISPITIDKTLEYTDQEKEYQALWRQYFKKIAIQERTNLKLQQHFVPKKYRKYLVEMEESIV
ncbi:TIGR03915 family putative DNA repair protein [Candidatus Auribacterota bacterium]